MSLVRDSNEYHTVSSSRLNVYRDSYGGLVNFADTVVDFRVLAPSELFGVDIMDRSVLLTFTPAQVAGISFVQAIVTFASGLSGFVSFGINFNDIISYAFDITASGVSTLDFPDSQTLSVANSFELSLRRDEAVADWQSRFSCLFVGGEVDVPLVQSIPSGSSCVFNFENIPSGSGRIELYQGSALVWSFAVEFS